MHRRGPATRLAALGLLLIVGIAPIAGTPGQAQAPPAEQLLAAALARARAEDKVVFVDFGASWCAPCRDLEAFFHDPDTAAILESEFVILRLTIWERGAKSALDNPGAEALGVSLGGIDGIPFYATIDAAGQKIASGGGYPGSRQYVPEFLALLSKSAPRLTPAALESLSRIFVGHSGGLGTIEGRVSTADGRPVGRAPVMVMGEAFIDGRWQPVRTARAESDFDGHYVVDVAPGRYRVVVEPPAGLSMGLSDRRSYEVTFHPATHDAGVARPVVVGRGEGLGGVDIALAPVSAFDVTGLVRASNGQSLAAASVTLVSVDWPTRRLTTRADASGRFTAAGVPAGRYNVWTWGDVPTSGPGRPVERGTMVLAVPGGAASPVVVTTAPGGVLRGSVRFDGPVIPPEVRENLRVMAVPIDPPAGAPAGIPQARVSGDGTFDVSNVFGARVLRVEGLPSGWVLESVTHRGADLTDRVLSVGGTDRMDGIEVVASNHAGVIEGRVVDPDGRVATGGAVLVFAVDAHHWDYPSRFVHRVAVQDNGTFVTPALPPTDYAVVALEVLPRNWNAPETLEAVTPHATLVSVTAGATSTPTLTMLPKER